MGFAEHFGHCPFDNNLARFTITVVQYCTDRGRKAKGPQTEKFPIFGKLPSLAPCAPQRTLVWQPGVLKCSNDSWLQGNGNPLNTRGVSTYSFFLIVRTLKNN